MVKMLLLVVALLPCVLMEEMNDKWAFSIYLGDTIELDCNDSSIMVESSDVFMWTTPDGRSLSSPFNDSHYELKGQNGQMLSVKSITMSQNGLYTCVAQQESAGTLHARGYALRGINLSGPLFKNLNDKYEENVIVAVVAALVFAVPMTGMCAINKFRYRKKGQKDEGRAYILTDNSEKKTAPEVVVSAYDNPAADFSTQL